MQHGGPFDHHKHRFAALFRRAPWLMSLGLRLLRPTHARFTAGVVGVVLNKAGAVLLVEHVFHAPDPWGLPGGWIDRHETPQAALKREMHEELGLDVTVLEPVLVGQGGHSAHLDIAFRCRAENEVGQLCAELLEYRWAPQGDLPPMPPFHQAAVSSALSRQLCEDTDT